MQPLEHYEILLRARHTLLGWVRELSAEQYRQEFTPHTLAFQLFYHEVHHRAQVMAMLRQLGIPAQDLDFNDFAFEWTELPG